jgi:hypothetical protein
MYENFDPFFDVIANDEADWIIKEEEYSNQRFGWKTKLPSILKKYIKSKNKFAKSKSYKYLHAYNILRNTKYSSAFMYISPFNSNKTER